MSGSDLDKLFAAYRLAPGNLPLLYLLVDALTKADRAPEALDLLRAAPAADLTEEGRAALAGLFIIAGDARSALELAGGDSAQSLIVRARAHAALRGFRDGLKLYDRAVSADPALEDRDLRNRLMVGLEDTAQTQGGNVVSFNVIRNEARDRQADSADDPAALLQPQQSTVTFADVGGLDEVKKQIHRRIVLPFQKPSLFQKFGRRAGGGVLLYGPPGCGKTLLARATAGECKARFYAVAISDILDMWFGESERKLGAIFEQARRTAPAVLFFDELEALAGKRQYSTDGSAARLVSQFLSSMDGFGQNNREVLILGATNVPWAVDPAFRRPGRFDRVLFVPPPDRAARESILRLLLTDRPVASDVDERVLAKACAGFSGADLRHLVETACDMAIEESIGAGAERPVQAAHLQQALREVKPTTTEWLTTARNYARYANEGGQYDEVLAFLDQHGR
jgi:ATP-dependent 26S proteasome regulatory subunit